MPRILVAEDDENTRQLLDTFLRLRLPECEVVFVENGAQAVAEDRKRPFDLCVFDIGMPVMSGDEAAFCIQQERPDALVVAFTGYERDCQSKPEVKRVRWAAFLFKPDDMLDLAPMVREVLAGRVKPDIA